VIVKPFGVMVSIPRMDASILGPGDVPVGVLLCDEVDVKPCARQIKRRSRFGGLAITRASPRVTPVVRDSDD